jgi:general stress protein 26
MKQLVFVMAGCLLLTFVCAEDLYRSDDRETIIAAAREIMKDDPDCALITVGLDGQPRARTLTASPPADDMTVWLATRPSTRKVEQIKKNPKVTLYYDDDDKNSYVSIMGVATLHPSLESRGVKSWFSEPIFRGFWPNYPENFVLIEVKPVWLEVTGEGVAMEPKAWRPQAAEFK